MVSYHFRLIYSDLIWAIGLNCCEVNDWEKYGMELGGTKL